MEYAYLYGDPGCLYLNVTDRCTNRYRFRIRNFTRGLGGAAVLGGEEPDFKSLKESVLAYGPLAGFGEFVWCGFGEPAFRLDFIRRPAGFGAREP